MNGLVRLVMIGVVVPLTLAAAWVHISTFRSDWIGRQEDYGSLQGAIFLLLFFTSGGVRLHRALTRRLRARTQGRPLPIFLATEMPTTLKIGCVLAVAAFFSFFLLPIIAFGDGSAVRIDERYVWMRGGAQVKELTSAEYHQFNARIVRATSAFWIAGGVIVLWVVPGLVGRLVALWRLNQEAGAENPSRHWS